MDLERPHRTTSTPTTSELFICFTSRLSNSSSMRLSSKSILSPCRSADGKPSHTTSLSCRLRHNGSLRGGGAGGGQSPAMFTTKKNRGCSAFENPEPSSPKVTCIGQVRVKTKKQGKKMKMKACRSKSKRFNKGGETSFRRLELANEGLTHQSNNQGVLNQPQDSSFTHRNQKWVHLPFTICEALRAFGAEFSCLLPCIRSSCSSSSEREKGEKGVNGQERETSGSSCGAVFRWLVALQVEEGEGRDVELVVGDEVEEREGRERMMMERECSRRRSVFDDMEFKDENFGVNDGEQEEGARVSICIPPKNALLLMRCRSDPMKMAALSNKLWEPPLPNDVDFEEEEEEKEGDFKDSCVNKLGEKTEVNNEGEKLGDFDKENDEICKDLVVIESNVEEKEMGFEDLPVSTEEETEEIKKETEEEQSTKDTKQQETAKNSEETQLMEDEYLANDCLVGTFMVEEELEDGVNEQDLVKVLEHQEEETERAESSHLSSSSSSTEDSTAESQEIQQKQEEKDPVEEQEALISKEVEPPLEGPHQRSKPYLAETAGKFEKKLEALASMEVQPPLEGQMTSTHQTSKSDLSETTGKFEKDPEALASMEVEPPLESELKLTHQRSKPNLKVVVEKFEKDHEISKPPLPDCLLLMMCEPKLSMEVSNETWVCSTDFIRWLPERHHNKKVNKSDGCNESKKKKAPTVQPARSSISFPAGGDSSVANLIEEKLVKAGLGCEPFALTRCKSAPMRSVAKIPPPDLPCSLWRRENSRRLEPHRSATFGVGAAGVGF